MQLLAIIVAIPFIGLSILHLYWVFGGKSGMTKTVPAVNNQPVFVPGPVSTAIVAGGLAGFALLALTLGFGLLPANYQPYAKFAGFAVGAILILRAIGEFRYVGFFKRIKGSDFATYDTRYYSPFCLLMGSLFLWLAVNQL